MCVEWTYSAFIFIISNCSFDIDVSSSIGLKMTLRMSNLNEMGWVMVFYILCYILISIGGQQPHDSIPLLLPAE